MKQIILTLSIIVSGHLVFAQQDSVRVTEENVSSNIKLAYNSSIVYPGLKAGIELPFRKRIINKTKKLGKERHLFKERLFSTNLGWYHHSTFHNNLYITAGFTMRRTNQKGLFTEFSPELGYSRTFLGGTTYQVNENGNVSIKKMAGYNYALVSLGVGLGYDFSVSKSKPIAIYSKINMLTMFPYNSTIYIRPTVELGIIYKPKNFLKFNSKTKHIHKDKSQL